MYKRQLWDEAANTGQVPNLEKLVAVIRSREVSLTLFYPVSYTHLDVYKRQVRDSIIAVRKIFKDFFENRPHE